jgi:hypothetical protein
MYRENVFAAMKMEKKGIHSTRSTSHASVAASSASAVAHQSDALRPFSGSGRKLGS